MGRGAALRVGGQGSAQSLPTRAGRCKPIAGGILGGWLLAGLAAAQQRPHLVGGVPAMAARRADGRDPPRRAQSVTARSDTWKSSATSRVRSSRPRMLSGSTPLPTSSSSSASRSRTRSKACLLRRRRSPTLRARSVPDEGCEQRDEPPVAGHSVRHERKCWSSRSTVVADHASDTQVAWKPYGTRCGRATLATGPAATSVASSTTKPAARRWPRRGRSRGATPRRRPSPASSPGRRATRRRARSDRAPRSGASPAAEVVLDHAAEVDGALGGPVLHEVAVAVLPSRPAEVAGRQLAMVRPSSSTSDVGRASRPPCRRSSGAGPTRPPSTPPPPSNIESTGGRRRRPRRSPSPEGVHAVEHVAGLDLGPTAHLGPVAAEGQHPDPRAVGRIPEEGEHVAGRRVLDHGHGRLEVEHHRQVPEHGVGLGDGEVVDHRRARDRDLGAVHQASRRRRRRGT